MELTILTRSCATGEILPLLPPGCPLPGHISESRPDPSNLPPGAILKMSSRPVFQIAGYDWLPAGCDPYSSIFAPLLRSLDSVLESSGLYSSFISGWSLAVVTLSDKGWRGEREDRAGPAVARMAADILPLSLTRFFLVPDDRGKLKALLARLALEECYNLILTSGGTGLSERDITPETTLSVLDKTLPGFSLAMTQASLTITPRAIISRAVAGIIGRCLVINLPGSEKAARENLAAILPGLDHALEKLNGDQTDCGA